MRIEDYCEHMRGEPGRHHARFRGVPGQNHISSCLLHSVDTTTSVVVFKADAKVCRLAGWTPKNNASFSGYKKSRRPHLRRPKISSYHDRLSDFIHNHHQSHLSITKLCLESRVLASNAASRSRRYSAKHEPATSYSQATYEFPQGSANPARARPTTSSYVGQSACVNPAPETASKQKLFRKP